MSSTRGLSDNAYEELRQEFLTWIDEELGSLELCVTDGNEDGSRNNEMLRKVHNIKGTCGSFGYRMISLIAHRMEDFLESTDIDCGDNDYKEELLKFIDEMSRMSETTMAPTDESAKRILSSLPTAIEFRNRENSPASQGGVLKTSKEVLVITPSKTISAIARTVFESLGHRVVGSRTGLEGLNIAISTQPDFVVTASVLDDLAGAEICRALSVMHNMKKTKIILISTLDKDHPDLKDIPDTVDIIQQAGNFPMELFKHIKQLG